MFFFPQVQLHVVAGEGSEMLQPVCSTELLAPAPICSSLLSQSPSKPALHCP